MRTFFLLSMLATVATLSYFLGPDIVEAYNERENLVAERQVVAVAEDTKLPDSATFEPRTDENSGIRASLSNLRHSVGAGATRASAPAAKTNREKADKARSPGPKVRPVKRRTAEAERAELQRLGLTPANSDRVPTDAVVQQPQARPRSVYSPMAGRWIEDLSGPKARVNMGVKSRQGSCADDYSHCSRPDAPDDISVAGVVVHTEELAKHPREPLHGDIRRGHFLDTTPVVYVE